MSASTSASNSGAQPLLEDKALLETKHRVLLMGAVMMVTITQLLDVTIANVALPHMQSSLGATFDTISWILTSYIIAGVLVTPIIGWLSDYIGSRRVFIGAVAGFLLASMLCGMAGSLLQMVLFRGLQGICAAFIGPIAQAILLDINPPSKQAKAMSVWGMAVMIAPISGPMLGGLLTDTLSWRWVFYINIPIGIPTLAILIWQLPSRPIARRKLDLSGFALLAIALGSLQLMLDRGAHNDWFSSREIVLELIIALSAFWIYFVHTMGTEKPLFPTALMKDRNFTGALGSMFVIGVANVAIASILPTMYQTVYGYTAFDTGVLLIPRAIGIFISMTIATRIMYKIDLRYLVAAGYSVAGFAMWQMAGWSLEMDKWPIVSTGFVQGLGLGCIFMPMNMVAISTLAPQFRPDGASIINLMRNIGGSFGISVIVSMLARNTQTSHADMATNVTASSLSAIDPATLAERFGASGTAVLQMIDGEINRQSMMMAYIDNFYAMSIFIFCIAASMLFVKPMRIATGPKAVPIE
jgi:DHA2 family multidrug resistance protein